MISTSGGPHCLLPKLNTEGRGGQLPRLLPPDGDDVVAAGEEVGVGHIGPGQEGQENSQAGDLTQHPRLLEI